MKTRVLVIATLFSVFGPAFGEVLIWRCGASYADSSTPTQDAELQKRGCIRVSGARQAPAPEPEHVSRKRQAPMRRLLHVPRAPDGHFYVDGSVNGTPVRFMIDTGASFVAITDRLAAASGFIPTKVITLSTAGGDRLGRSGLGVVAAGHLSAARVEITTGIPEDQGFGLLGQSFLRRFDIEVNGDTMVIKQVR